MGRAYVGCSGWQYRHWRGSFYPPELSQKDWLEHYASVFDTVEINNSFYRLPDAGTFARWADRVPSRFIFSVKASRFLTHMKKLKDPEQPLELLIERARALGRHLGPILYQLPPGWKLDLPRLEYFLQVLPARRRHAIEFRDPSWYADGVLRLLEGHRVALCLHDMPGSAPGRQRVGPFVYVRFHGATAKYGGSYSARRLRPWIEWLHAQRAGGADVYVYFNNDVGGHAPRDALTLRHGLESSL
jgi:uncharacterized protein YecE (DUF72 family)